MSCADQLIVEWEVTLKCNYTCKYCTNLDPAIKPVTCENKLEDFIIKISEQYPGVELFIFGGEPFLHPKIDFIINTLNKYDVSFVIQTNLSKKSVKVINRIKDDMTLQVSVHPSQVKIDDMIFPEDSSSIRLIDVMFDSESAIKYYFKLKKQYDDKLQLTPVTDFNNTSDHLKILKKFNEMRRQNKFNGLIRYESTKKLGMHRSEMWEDDRSNFKNKPCIYGERYRLYTPNLDLKNCCYRVNHDGVCKFNKCFLM